ncbi:MAG: FKBP-type peptidyl-prolyl cis-trans isomerase [Magnetovibrio sp.]|nr:FKBP-type peptidyl-prolyl cis-trans isomerase [Magnetovibrio sp.]
MRKLITSGLFALFVLVGALPSAQAGELIITDIKVGKGALAEKYAEVSVHYTGWTLDGKKFDSSVDRGKPFRFKLGARSVIQGWDLGVEGMRVGGKRELIIPPEMAYGSKGAGNAIPPNATLKFAVELLAVVGPNFKNINSQQLQKMIDKGVTVIDLRRPDEWDATGVIKGAHLITAFDIDNRLQVDFLPKLQSVVGLNDEVIIICRSGKRSSRISNALANNKGFKGIYNVKGGMTQWIKDGGTVVNR